MEKFIVGVQVTILGMGVVVAILLLLYVCMAVMRRFAGQEEEEPPRRRMKPVAKPEPAARTEKKHDPKIIAAITAAVLAASEADAQPRVRALRLSQSDGRQWKTAARMESLAGVRSD